jgi:hypothetical protein
MTTHHINGNKWVLLEERVAIGKAPAGGRVDRKAKLIRGVKILGFHSRNPGSVLGKDFANMTGYDYDPSAIKAALLLYEGAPVNLDHLDAKRDNNGMRVTNSSRHVKERFGKLQNVRVETDGAYADIRYVDNHPLTPMVLEAAEEMPDVFTMSHHAHGEVDKGKNNRAKVTKINQVHSVDLIAERPGTTTSLFESSSMDDDGAMTNEAAAVQPAAGTQANSGSRDSFCQDVLAACQNADLDLAGTALRVLQAVLKAASNASAQSSESCDGKAPVREGDGDDASADSGGGSDESMQESLRSPKIVGLQKRVRLLESRERASIVMSQRGLTLTSELITAVAAQEDDRAQQALIESLAAGLTCLAPGGTLARPVQKPLLSRPRTAAPFSTPTSRSDRLGPTDATHDLLLSLGRTRLK